MRMKREVLKRQEPRVRTCREYRGRKRVQKQRADERNTGQTSEGPCSRIAVWWRGKLRGGHPGRGPRGWTEEAAQRLGGEVEKQSESAGGTEGWGWRQGFPEAPPHPRCRTSPTGRRRRSTWRHLRAPGFEPCPLSPQPTPGCSRYSVLLPGRAQRPRRRHCLHRYPGDREARAHWLADHEGDSRMGLLDVEAGVGRD